jgi:RecA/RadA recombinase
MEKGSFEQKQTEIKQCHQDGNEQLQTTTAHHPNSSSRNNSNDPVRFGNQMRFLPTGHTYLDDILRGGIRLATVTEIVGKSGLGKTQLALQLCVMAAKFNQGAIYVDTERKLIPERLIEMSGQRVKLDSRRTKHHTSSSFHHMKEQGRNGFNYSVGTHPTPDSYHHQFSQGIQSNQTHDTLYDIIGAYKSGDRVLSNLTIHKPSSTEELLTVLAGLEDEILKRNQIAIESARVFSGHSTRNPYDNRNKVIVQGKFPVRLLIVDSIAAPMRRDFGADFAPQRAATVFQCAQVLKRLADQLHLAVVVINQVGSSNNCDGGCSGISAINHLSFNAALGTSWHHCISTRLLIESTTKNIVEHQPSRRDEHIENFTAWGLKKEHQKQDIRRISAVKSNLTGFAETHFEVSELGIVEVSSSQQHQDEANRTEGGRA